MNTIKDDTNTIVDPESEVKKLQDLVKKLEQQNQLLRNKQNDTKKTGCVISTQKITENGDVRLKSKFKRATDNERDSMKDCSLEEVALVDVDHGMFDDDDDNW